MKKELGIVVALFCVQCLFGFDLPSVSEERLTDSENPMGKTWVLFVENTNYQFFSSLQGPTRDVMTMMQSLSAYQVDSMLHRKNLTKTEMERFFAIELRDLLKENNVNSLLIWYAGHGKYINQTGYWVPVDGDQQEEFSLFSINSLRVSIQSYMTQLTHVLVVTDACESGPAFAEESNEVSNTNSCIDYKSLVHKSAQVLSSAGYELASDNSQFTKSFSSILDANNQSCLSIQEVADRVGAIVSKSGNQSPKFGAIKGVTDENGAFVFIR